MTNNRDGDGSKSDRDASQRAAADRDAQRKRASEPAETSNLVVSVSADSDDLDVLRTVLERIDNGQAEVHDVLTQLGADFFSEENGWRQLFVRLLAAPADAAAFKRRALSDYLARLEKARGGGSAAGAPSNQSTDEEKRAASEDIAHLAKLVRGRPTQLLFDGVSRIECRLGHCVLWITPGSPPKLAITGQHSIPLEVGITRVGRAPDNDVALGERWPDVSRRHLVIEVTRARDLLLTDISTHGTLVSKSALLGKH